MGLGVFARVSTTVWKVAACPCSVLALDARLCEWRPVFCFVVVAPERSGWAREAGQSPVAIGPLSAVRQLGLDSPGGPLLETAQSV